MGKTICLERLENIGVSQDNKFSVKKDILPVDIKKDE